MNAVAMLHDCGQRQGRALLPTPLSRLEHLWIAFGCWAMGVQAAMDDVCGWWE